MALSDPLIGQHLGDYRIDDLLGRGGMAHVYRGYDPKLQRYAAVKVIDANLLAKDNEDEYRLRFQREARAIAHLNHPNIVGVYQFGEVDVLYYMAMVFIEGRDLGQILKQHAADGTLMSYQQILQIIHDIGSALDYAHTAGVIHRDIKPSNIMVTLDHRAVLTDFGLALSVPEGTLGNTFGSAYYIAPEQAISSANAIAQSDLYSLGVVLFQMLTGRVPFDDPSAMSVALMHLSDPPPTPRSINPALSPAVEQVMLKAIEKEPSKRYQSGDQLIHALQDALNLTTLNENYQIATGTPQPTGKLTTGEYVQTLMYSDSQVATSRLRLQNAQRKLNPNARGRTVLYALIVLIILFAGVFGAWSLLRNGADDSDLTPTVVAAAVTEEPTALTPTARDTPITIGIVDTVIQTLTMQSITITTAPTDTFTPQPTVSPATAVPMLMLTNLPTDTSAPTLTSTPTPLSTLALPHGATRTPSDTPILLTYDNDKLVLSNRADHALNISYLYFSQQGAIGEISFYANQWETPRLNAVQPNTCLVIWRNNVAQVRLPDYCLEREAWYAAGTRSRFWISNQPNAIFKVSNAGVLIATCTISVGACAIDPEADSN